MDESRIGQYSISVTTYPIMALVLGYDRLFQFQARYTFLDEGLCK